MGYEIHITRAKSWMDNKGAEILVAEWLRIVEEDPELHLAGFNGPCFTLWKVKPGDWDASTEWLDWSRGNIDSKHPSEELISKMLKIADELNAKVQGDDLEVYRSGDYNDYYYDEENRPLPPRTLKRFEWAYYIPPWGISGKRGESASILAYQLFRNLKRWVTGK